MDVDKYKKQLLKAVTVRDLFETNDATVHYHVNAWHHGQYESFEGMLCTLVRDLAKKNESLKEHLVKARRENTGFVISGDVQQVTQDVWRNSLLNGAWLNPNCDGIELAQDKDDPSCPNHWLNPITGICPDCKRNT